MNNGQSFYLALVVIGIAGCAAPRPHAFVPNPEPPVEWNILVENGGGCPSFTGEYELIPKVAEFQKDGVWRVSNGNWYDYLLLIPFNRVETDEWTPNETSPVYPRSSLLFESNEQGDTLNIVSPDKNNENFVTHIFSKAENDYTCQAGNLVFPEFHIQGGTEGAYLSGKTYRQATKTSSGNLLFYEQTQSHKTIHKYYLFKLKYSQDAPG